MLNNCKKKDLMPTFLSQECKGVFVRHEPRRGHPGIFNITKKSTL